MNIRIKPILAWLTAGIVLFSGAAEAMPLESSAPLSLTAPSYILMEAETNTVIFSHHADEMRETASLVKLMTILLCMEALETGAVTAETPVIVSAQAAKTPGATALLDANSAYPLKELLRACIMASANDAAVALAECIAGSQEAFVAQMNQKAAQLNLTNTHYVNCTGLTADGQHTTAQDCAVIASALCKYPEYFDDAAKWTYTFTHPSGRKTDLTNTNRLVRFYQGCDGMKTGSSPEAKYCICATAANDNLRLIAVVLGASGSQVRFDEAKAMLEYGLTNYRRTNIIARGEMTGYSLPVEHGARESVNIASGKGLSVLLKSGQEKLLSVELSLPQSITAPMQQGDAVGEIHVLLDGRQIASLPAVLSEDVRLPGFIEGFVRILKGWQ